MSKGKKRNVIPNIVLCNKLTEACGPCTHGEPHQPKGNEDCGPSPCLYMGQRSVKCVQIAEVTTMTKEILDRLSSAIRRLATAASNKFGGDCYLHAAIGQAVLADECGIKSRITAGFAAWRVGDGDGDVITHWPTVPVPLEEVFDSFMYHAWLEVDNYILDLTTYQLVAKGRMLDAQDGGKTDVQWCPDYLYVPNGKQLTLEAVTNGNQGDFSYNSNPVIETLLARSYVLDPVDVHLARVLYQNPSCQVVGPNDMKA